MTIRSPLVAGRFYPQSRSLIELEIKKAEERVIPVGQDEKRPLVGGISPHAGYIFCLKHMIPLFELLNRRENRNRPIVIINPNHSGWGAPLSLDTHDAWETPMGKADLDPVLCHELISRHKGHCEITREPLAQRNEHSAEVLLPLLSYYLNSFSFIPLSMGMVTVETARHLAEKIFHIKKKKGIDPVIMASSDFNHFSTPRQGRLLDDMALAPLLNFDSSGFYNVIKENHITICGYGPIMVLLEYAKLVSSNPEISLLSRGHSGESEYYGRNKPEEVVDYISLAVFGQA